MIIWQDFRERVAHLKCSWNYSAISVYIHNFSRYGSHLFVKEIGFIRQKVNTNNEESYVSFSESIDGDTTVSGLY